jgi:hypothetical protein
MEQTIMIAQANHSPRSTQSLGSSRPSLGAGLGALKTYLAAWIKTCADYYEAAALYDKLSVLSDAELHRRRLSRATLAQDICNACDSTAR